jgi:lipopolysaccharide transport system ATP-binding protein
MSSDKIAIHVSHLGKYYRIGGPQEPYHTLRDAIVNSVKAPFKRFNQAPPDDGFWALKDVSFDVQKGEVIGIIGRNGAGKSTLLKILSRITTPTEGIVELYGRVGSLLEVGTGFHPELTGRENIFLSGSIIGMKRSEIQEKFDKIVKFSEIEKFIDTPVKRYSSGMYVRLAFAVAAHLDPEILIVDEVLAVGDLAFQTKCLGKMGEIAKEGRTVLFVSHNMGAILNLCGSAIWLENGQIVKRGTSDEVIRDYENKQLKNFNESSCIVERNPEDTQKPGFYFSHAEILNEKGEYVNLFKYGEKLILIVEFGNVSPMYQFNKEKYSVEFWIYNELNQLVSIGASGPYHDKYFNGKVRKIKIEIGPLNITSGKYKILFSVLVEGQRTDTWKNAIGFTITECQPFETHWEMPTFREGVCVLQQSFSEVE